MNDLTTAIRRALARWHLAAQSGGVLNARVKLDDGPAFTIYIRV
jgi:hypothetical protein